MSAVSAPLALLFAGQGSQVPGMGASLAETCDGCRATFAAADAALGYSLHRVLVSGTAEELRRTEITQPALLTLGVAHAEHLAGLGIRPTMVLGHSLGQYTALVASGALSFEDALRLVALRGKLMQEAVPEGEGAMVVISGLDIAHVEEACTRSRVESSAMAASIACINAPRQLVIAGPASAVDMASTWCEEAGGGIIQLEVSAPFHCPMLTPMIPGFREALAKVVIRKPMIPVIDNVTGVAVWEPDAIRSFLLRHLTEPVQFAASLSYAASQGVRRFVQCGPGASLLSFVKRCVPGAIGTTFEQELQGHTRDAEQKRVVHVAA